jgi:hypothetical protein
MNLDLKSPPRLNRWASVRLLVLLASVALVTGAFSSSASAQAARHKAPILAPCQQVAAVLSDGPDPGADPVGYAQAQVIQLRKLKLSSRKLKHAVRELASAYALFSKTDGKSKSAKTDVKKAVRAVNAICPGAAS